MNADYESDENQIMRSMHSQMQVLLFPDFLEIHELIRLKRLHDSLRQTDLCRILGISVTMLSNIERGAQIPKKWQGKIDEYLYNSWYVSGELYQTIDQLGIESDECI